MDRDTPWTAATLAIIGAHPQIAASRLAAKLGRETAPFKVDVRKLKKLGLTQSFEVGYEISPRGRAYLDAVRASPRGRGAAKKQGAGAAKKQAASRARKASSTVTPTPMARCAVRRWCCAMASTS